MDLTIDPPPQADWTKLEKRKRANPAKAMTLGKGSKLSFDRHSVDTNILGQFINHRQTLVNSTLADLQKDKQFWRKEAEAMQLSKSLLRAQADLVSGTYDTFKLKYATIELAETRRKSLARQESQSMDSSKAGPASAASVKRVSLRNQDRELEAARRAAAKLAAA